MADDRHARISEEAYRLWKQEGEPHGRDREHWEQAERAFAGEGPVADEPDPQVDADAGTAAPAVGADVAEPPAATAAPEPVAVPEPAAKGAAKKPATRRKRTT